MLQTYKAVLRGNQLEWRGEAPAAAEEEREVAVYVTILDEPVSQPDAVMAGAQIAAILEQLVQLGGLQAIEDPVAWEREQRS